jgi:hypothetical protein
MCRNVLLVLFSLQALSIPAICQEQEVTIGAQVWLYDRVYPLLDGLLQDAASTQVNQLILDPNKANSSQLDALIQSFQVQAGYNQLSGVQNSVAAQMAQANVAYQSTLTQQQQIILQQSISAQQALTKALQDQTAANASQIPSQVTAANTEVQSAQAVVTGLAAQSALVKGSGTPYAPSPATGSIANTPSAFTSGVPATVLGTGTSTSGPSFPATKQLDNQMDLLWSRLARVVGAMARPDSIDRDSRMYMIEFDTATFPAKSRKGRLLDTRYQLSCGQVVDLFPRVAAVNVANTKYRDNADAFGVLLSFFSFAVNASYNREHLKMSQTLGQSSYITGYGVDQGVFGWKFGIPLGDNFVSSDTKRTFALVVMPAACAAPTLTLQEAIWEKPDGSKHQPVVPPTDFANVNNQLKPADEAAVAAAAAAAPPDVKNISFNRAIYDPTKYTPASPVLVSLSVTLRQPIDQEATVYANGILLKRARDTFGRAIPAGAGSGGLLEESVSIAQANTWIPISPRKLLITLDAGQFGAMFPTIQINSPGPEGPVVISSSVVDGTGVADSTEIEVSGQPVHCMTKVGGIVCQLALPSLAYPVPVSASLGVILWQRNCDPDPVKGCVYDLVVQAPSVSTAATAATSSAFQVASGSGVNPWGPNPEVYVTVPTIPELGPKQFRLKCNSGNSSDVDVRNLDCELWDEATSPDFGANYAPPNDIHLQVIDAGHVGGSLLGSVVLPGDAWGIDSKTPPRKSLWSASNIQWYDNQKEPDGGHWDFQIKFANLQTQNPSQLVISPDPVQGRGPIPPTSCNSASGICMWDFQIAPRDIPNWSDRLDITFDGDPDHKWQLLFIRSQVFPHVTVMGPDFSSWSGNNFTQVFSSSKDSTNKTGLMIGSTLYPIECATPNSCVVSDKTKLPTKAGGAMTLRALNQSFPLMQQNADGSATQITYQPTSTTNPAGGGGAGPAQGAQTSQANQQGQATPTATATPAQVINTIVVEVPKN